MILGKSSPAEEQLKLIASSDFSAMTERNRCYPSFTWNDY